MPSPSSIFPSLCAASLLTLGGPAPVQALDGDAPEADRAASAGGSTQAQLDDLFARVRHLEAERDARLVATPAPAPATSNPFVLGGYVEALYSWNFNAPSNGLTNFRGFDNRHNSFTLSNVALDATWDYRDLIGRLTLQVGHTPSAYYLAEPSSPGSSSVNASSGKLWKYVEQAYVGYRFHFAGRPLNVSAGLYLSPIGPESMAVKDNWNWSRSNLFFGLPFYHTGVRATYALTNAWALTLAVYNGWNSIVDDNAAKSVSAQVTFTRPDVLASLLYFGGIERPSGAPEGRAWRHLFDAHATWHARRWLSLLAHANGGVEPNRFGVSGWVAGALYARFRVAPQLYLVARGDLFYEQVASSGAGTASPIFWPASWVSSGTATVDYEPHPRVSVRLEYRHDQAAGDLYFGGEVVGDGSATSPFVPNRASQDTLTLGATAWF